MDWVLNFNFGLGSLARASVKVALNFSFLVNVEPCFTDQPTADHVPASSIITLVSLLPDFPTCAKRFFVYTESPRCDGEHSFFVTRR